MDIRDVKFNTGAWGDFITSQAALFAVEELHRVSDEIRDVFYDAHPPGRKMPEIERISWKSPLLEEYAHGEIGYDLPFLLSLDRPAKGRIMFCAQDPLRIGTDAKVTVGTFFGVDNDYYRRRRHYKMLWNLVLRCLGAGYDVWVTDAIKIYAGRGVVARNAPLRELSFAVLRKEVEGVDPVRILAFGGVAHWSLSEAAVGRPFIRAIHPTARGVAGSMVERGQRYWDSLELDEH